jgi:hypothetical protein
MISARVFLAKGPCPTIGSPLMTGNKVSAVARLAADSDRFLVF